MHRSTLLATCLALTALLAAGCGDDEPSGDATRPVKLALDFQPNAVHAGIYAAVADGIDRTTSRQLDIMVRLAEPALLMVMGGVILFVLVALLLPVFEMSANMS